MSSEVTVVARLRSAPGKGDELASLLAEQVAIVRETEPGNVVYRPHRAVEDAESFVFYEQYVSQEAFEAHGRSPRIGQFAERCARDGLLGGPVDDELEIEIFRELEG